MAIAFREMQRRMNLVVKIYDFLARFDVLALAVPLASAVAGDLRFLPVVVPVLVALTALLPLPLVVLEAVDASES